MAKGMTAQAYNEKLDAIALEAMKCCLRDERTYLNNTSAAVAGWAYGYALAMMDERESHIK